MNGKDLEWACTAEKVHIVFHGCGGMHNICHFFVLYCSLETLAAKHQTQPAPRATVAQVTHLSNSPSSMRRSTEHQAPEQDRHVFASTDHGSSRRELETPQGVCMAFQRFYSNRLSLSAGLLLNNGGHTHYIIESKVQWKPFWLAAKQYPQNNWLGGNFPHTMSYAHGPHWKPERRWQWGMQAWCCWRRLAWWCSKYIKAQTHWSIWLWLWSFFSFVHRGIEKLGRTLLVNRTITRNRPVDFVTASFTTREFCLMIDCNWSWNLQLQNPLACFSWWHQLPPVSQLGIEHRSWGGLFDCLGRTAQKSVRKSWSNVPPNCLLVLNFYTKLNRKWFDKSRVEKVGIGVTFQAPLFAWQRAELEMPYKYLITSWHVTWRSLYFGMLVLIGWQLDIHPHSIFAAFKRRVETFISRLKAACRILRFQVPLYLHVISRFQPRVVSGHRSASLPRRFAARERLAGIRFLLGEEPIRLFPPPFPPPSKFPSFFSIPARIAAAIQDNLRYLHTHLKTGHILPTLLQEGVINLVEYRGLLAICGARGDPDGTKELVSYLFAKSYGQIRNFLKFCELPNEELQPRFGQFLTEGGDAHETMPIQGKRVRPPLYRPHKP